MSPPPGAHPAIGVDDAARTLDALRAAGRALERRRTARALAACFAAWRQPQSGWVDALVAAGSPFSRAGLERGLALGLEHWTEDALHRWVERELCIAPLSAPSPVTATRTDRVAPGLTAVFVAGSIPTNVLGLIAGPLLVGSAVYAHPPHTDPHTVRAVIASIRAIDPGVGEAIAAGDDRSVLRHADAIVAEGRDATLAEIRSASPTSATFVGYGAKLSAAAIGGDAEIESCAEAAALDVALFDGRGCLSPAVLLIEDRPGGRARAVAERIAARLATLAQSMPRGDLSPAEHLGVHELRAEWCAQPESEAFLSARTTDFGVVLLPARADGPAGLTMPRGGSLRNVPAIAVRDREDLVRHVRGLAPSLSALGHVGWSLDPHELARVAASAGASRVCAIGCLQRPPITWRHDGAGAIAALLRDVDIETGTS